MVKSFFHKLHNRGSGLCPLAGTWGGIAAPASNTISGPRGGPTRARERHRRGPAEPTWAQGRHRRGPGEAQESPGEAQMRPRRAQESPGVAQNSPGANSKPDEVPKSLRVRMRALDYDAASAHCNKQGTRKRCPKNRMCARARAISSEKRCKEKAEQSAKKAARAHVRARSRQGAPQPRKEKKWRKRRTCTRARATQTCNSKKRHQNQRLPMARAQRRIRSGRGQETARCDAPPRSA